MKAIGLTVIFVYAFFKFAWVYRLYNYVAILLGATPLPAEKDTPEAEAHVLRTAGLFTTAGRHFNRGQRAFFFALGYLGWFAGPLVLIATTTVVVVVMWWRQYKSGLAARRRGQRNQSNSRRRAPLVQARSHRHETCKQHRGRAAHHIGGDDQILGDAWIVDGKPYREYGSANGTHTQFPATQQNATDLLLTL